MNEVGTVVGGRYRIEAHVGSGGFGEVFRAVDLQTEQSVALTIARPSLELGRAHQAFEREMSVLGRLAGEAHVVVGRQAGRLDDGRPYTVRDWVEGRSLADVLRGGPLKVRDAVVLADAIAQGLAAAHDLGILHRDIKPANVLIPGDGTADRFADAKLVDFGVKGELESSARLTATGQVFGTPAYMSPEQMSGARQGPAADIYGLGLLVYESLYGRPPHEGSNVIEVMRQRLTTAVSFPAAPRLPARLLDLLKRSLAIKVEERPQSAQEMRAVLREVLAEIDTPAQARGSTTMAMARPKAAPAPRRRSRGRRWAYGGLAGVSAAALFVAREAVTFSRLLIALLVIAAVALIPGGVLLHRQMVKRLRRRRTKAGDEAWAVLTHAQSRDVLTNSLAIEVEELLVRCRDLGEGVLGASVAILLKEVHDAKASGDRQSALMNLLTVLDKLTGRLSPWYVRHSGLVAFVASIVTIITGLYAAVLTVKRLLGS